jgi:hypothetical protein
VTTAGRAPVRRLRSGPGRDGSTATTAAHVYAPRPWQLLGGPRRDDPGQPVAGTDRLDLGGARRDDDLVGMDVQHAVRASDDDHRAGVDRNDLIAEPASRTRTDLPARSASARPRPAARSAADDRDVDLEMVRARSGPAAVSRSGPWRPPRGVPGSPAGCRATRSPARARLARPDVGDTIDLGQAVAAITGQAQRAAAPGTSPARRIAIATESPGSNGDGRPSTTIRAAPQSVAADATSVTGASGDPAGRTRARAGAAPAAAAR